MKCELRSRDSDPDSLHAAGVSVAIGVSKSPANREEVVIAAVPSAVNNVLFIVCSCFGCMFIRPLDLCCKIFIAMAVPVIDHLLSSLHFLEPNKFCFSEL